MQCNEVLETAVYTLNCMTDLAATLVDKLVLLVNYFVVGSNPTEVKLSCMYMYMYTCMQFTNL